MRISREQEHDIAELRAQEEPTRRVVVPALEEILYQPLSVLDRGFVRVVDYMGDDGAIVQAARVSYGRGTKKASDDRGLICYLMRHRHTTPFEMCEIKLHVKLPIFVARQWIRHRTANVNEYSARYSVLDNEFYIPDSDYLNTRRIERRLEETLKKGQPDLFGDFETKQPRYLAVQSTRNRQGRDDALPPEEADDTLEAIRSQSDRAYRAYAKLLNEDAEGNIRDPNRHGLARELARMVLPTNVYTQWYWKIDLHNLLHFVSLRADPHAQYEIRAYADVLLDVVRRWVPLAHDAFVNYRMSGAELSANALEVVRRRLRGEPVTQEASGLSLREWRELEALLPPD
jgi:thymidylate synthase (FAD)